jgi:hypothetical protein
MFALLVGLGILTMALVPLALPGLLFVVAPLVLVVAVGALLALPLVLPLWLLQTLRRGRSHRRARPADGSAAVGEIPPRVVGDSPPCARTS